jgi:uncharacterized membrane protein YhaH (DUF805 family)
MFRLLSNWFPFQGRIGCRRYWSLTLLYVFALFVGLAAIVAVGILLELGPTDAITLAIVPIIIIFMVSMSVAIAGIGVRRLHDRGKTGFWLLLYYAVPLWLTKNAGLDAIGLVVWLASAGILIWAIIDLGVLRGEAGTNAPMVRIPRPRLWTRWFLHPSPK